MKKIGLLLVLVMILALVLCGCDDTVGLVGCDFAAIPVLKIL